MSSLLNSLQNDTAMQQAAAAAAEREAAAKNGGVKDAQSAMGKEDFLMLLSAQLRYQDPLEPSKDSEFAAQLAQFSSLEQMQNMNSALQAMSNFQAYSMVGKYVLGQIEVEGELREVAGTVNSIFFDSKEGVTYAQVGEYAIPVSSIGEVFDNSFLLSPQELLDTSDNLIGRTVKGSLEIKNDDGTVKNEGIEGVVTGVTVKDGALYAYVDDGTGETKAIRVESIYDIRQPAAAADGAAQTTDGTGAPESI